MDLGPTLLDLAGIDVPEQFRGRSLLRSRPRSRPGLVMGGRTGAKGFQEWFVREGDWKLVANRTETRLYALPKDPGKCADRSEEHPILAGYLESRLWQASPAYRQGSSSSAAEDVGLSAEQAREREAALRALGYIE
jgi:arylsulfatase A-like enzyme